MAKLTQPQLKAHKEACELLKKPRDLTWEESIFVMSNWLPDAQSKTEGAAFFTPPWLASEMAICYADWGHPVDLAAGIGTLAFFQYHRLTWSGDPIQITCVEINPDFIKVGKKLVPQAQWIEGDIFDVNLWAKLDMAGNKFDSFISNPPFGPRKTNGEDWLVYRGNMALSAIEVGVRVTTEGLGTVILPQSICPWQYSIGLKEYQQVEVKGKLKFIPKGSYNLGYKVVKESVWLSPADNRKYREPMSDGKKFLDTFDNIIYIGNSSIDTLVPPDPDDWPGAAGFMDTNITVEICNIECAMNEPKPGLPLRQREMVLA